MKRYRKAGAIALAGLVLSLLPVAPLPAGAAVSATPVRIVGGPGHAGLYGWGATTMLDGSVLIGDYWNFRVAHYATDGTPLPDFVKNPGFGATQHQAPYGLATDPRNGDIYMADTDRYKVLKYDKNGNLLFTVGTNGDNGTGPGRFLYPSRVAVASDGRFYVIDTWDNNIAAFGPDGGTELFQFGSFGTANGQFKQPHGAAFDATDRLFVVDTNNHRVQVFDRSGAFLFKFGSKGTNPGQFAGDMRGLAIDKDKGWVYVVDAEGNRISKFDTSGTFLTRWGSTGTGNGQFSDGGREITVDGDGNVWVGDMPNFRAQKFSPTGQFLLAVPDPPKPPPLNGFNGPRGVALDRAGNIFVTDTYNQRVVKLGPNGQGLLAWGSRGRDDYEFNYPRLIATDPRNDDVVFVDTDNHRVKKYNNDGVFQWQVGGLGTGPLGFKNPHGIDVAEDGTIAVADSRNNRIQLLSPDGSFIRSFGSQGSGNGQFTFVRGVAWDPDGTLWTSDSGRDIITHFSATGAFLGQFGGKGTTDDKFSAPFDIEVDGSRVYVADSAAHKVKVWSKAGAFLGAFGGNGKVSGKMNQPQGLELVGNRLYVAEQGNERVAEWQVG
jgi:tripartite motif-containing protein 71